MTIFVFKNFFTFVFLHIFYQNRFHFLRGTIVVYMMANFQYSLFLLRHGKIFFFSCKGDDEWANRLEKGLAVVAFAPGGYRTKPNRSRRGALLPNQSFGLAPPQTERSVLIWVFFFCSLLLAVGCR